MMQLAGMELQPCLSGAVYVPAYEALLVADLHLEKGSSRAHLGVHLPPYDTRAGLAALDQRHQALAAQTGTAAGRQLS
jgi:metallophosphoesterase superfamily enzyme